MNPIRFTGYVLVSRPKRTQLALRGLNHHASSSIDQSDGYVVQGVWVSQSDETALLQKLRSPQNQGVTVLRIASGNLPKSGLVAWVTQQLQRLQDEATTA